MSESTSLLDCWILYKTLTLVSLPLARLMCSSWAAKSFANRLARNDGTLYTYLVQDTRFVGGFEYISREVIDTTVFGSEKMAKRALKAAAAVLEQVLDKAVALFPEEVGSLSLF